MPEAWETACANASAAAVALQLVVLGHVDAGKSTLVGRLLHACGALSDTAVAKLLRDAAAAGKGSFSWAWALDARAEERARGITLDVCTVELAMPLSDGGTRPVTLLDTPGHADFVPAALAGAAQADAALLLLDAAPGAFEAGFQRGGQTREHAALARALGCEALVVAVNKMDAAGWDEARRVRALACAQHQSAVKGARCARRFEFIRAEVQPFLRTCGWRDAAVSWVSIAALEGANLEVQLPTEHPLRAWQRRQPTLVASIAALPWPAPGSPRPLRAVVTSAISSGTRSLGALAAAVRVVAGAVRQTQQARVIDRTAARQGTELEHSTRLTLCAGARAAWRRAGDCEGAGAVRRLRDLCTCTRCTRAGTDLLRRVAAGARLRAVPPGLARASCAPRRGARLDAGRARPAAAGQPGALSAAALQPLLLREAAPTR